jgi:hypothetical protein
MSLLSSKTGKAAVILMIGGFFSMVAGVFAYQQEQNYQKNGRFAEGIITDKFLRKTKAQGQTGVQINQFGRETYNVAYSFVADDGKTYTGNEQLRDGGNIKFNIPIGQFVTTPLYLVEGKRVRDMKSVPVQFIAGNPGKHRIYHGERMFIVWICAGVGLAVMTMGLIGALKAKQ